MFSHYFEKVLLLTFIVSKIMFFTAASVSSMCFFMFFILSTIPKVMFLIRLFMFLLSFKNVSSWVMFMFWIVPFKFCTSSKNALSWISRLYWTDDRKSSSFHAHIYNFQSWSFQKILTQENPWIMCIVSKQEIKQNSDDNRDNSRNTDQIEVKKVTCPTSDVWL